MDDLLPTMSDLVRIIKSHWTVTRRSTLGRSCLSMMMMFWICPNIFSAPENSMKMFCQVIDNPRTICWYSSLNLSIKALTRMFKEMHMEAGVDDKGITNKSGRTTCVTRMTAIRFLA